MKLLHDNFEDNFRNFILIVFLLNFNVFCVSRRNELIQVENIFKVLLLKRLSTVQRTVLML
jgi:hypothetical protein